MNDLGNIIYECIIFIALLILGFYFKDTNAVLVEGFLFLYITMRHIDSEREERDDKKRSSNS